MGDVSWNVKGSEYGKFVGFLRLDKMEYNVVQKTYELTDLLAALGGLQRTIYAAFSFIVVFFSRKLFMTDILGALYQVKVRRTKGKKLDEEDIPSGGKP
jgi:hypothetical protein